MDATPETDISILRAQTRLLRGYRRLRRKGGWRALANEIGVSNVSYAYEFVQHGKLPANEEVREALMNFGLRRKARPMDDHMRKLWHLLSEHHVGREEAIKKRALRFEIYGSSPDVASDSNNNLYDRDLRSMIESLNRDHGGLVCSDSGVGYWWAENLKEGLRAVERSSSRPKKIMDNLAHLRRNIIFTFGGQASMFEQ